MPTAKAVPQTTKTKANKKGHTSGNRIKGAGGNKVGAGKGGRGRQPRSNKTRHQTKRPKGNSNKMDVDDGMASDDSDGVAIEEKGKADPPPHPSPMRKKPGSNKRGVQTDPVSSPDRTKDTKESETELSKDDDIEMKGVDKTKPESHSREGNHKQNNNANASKTIYHYFQDGRQDNSANDKPKPAPAVTKYKSKLTKEAETTKSAVAGMSAEDMMQRKREQTKLGTFPG